MSSLTSYSAVITVMPVTWFPEHRGKVIGFVMAGHGLAQTVFSPLQTLVVNPANIPPVSVRQEILGIIEKPSSLHTSHPMGYNYKLLKKIKQSLPSAST